MPHDTLDPGRIEPLLRSRFGRPYLYRQRCESTQYLLAGRCAEGAVAVAEEQTGGRGRLGRSWRAPARAAILCSILLAPPGRRVAPQLALVGGLAAASTVERATGRPTELKWPNDVILDGCKLAGVLAEARNDSVVLGIGLNVNQDQSALPPGGVIPAGSLRSITGMPHDRAQLLVDLLAQLEDTYGTWVAGGLAVLARELNTRDYLRGREVRCGDVTGVARGIGDDGRLRIETAVGPRLVASGEVELIA